MNYILNAYALQDLGYRSNQEDSFYPPFIDACQYEGKALRGSGKKGVAREKAYYDGTPHTDDRLFIVCDGMGGHARGEVASRIVTETMSKAILRSVSLEGAFNDDMVQNAVDEALDALIAQDDPTEVKKMGTTMTLLKFHAKGATVAHIGDSRVYQFRPARKNQPAKIMFRTEDHTMVNDMLHNGQLTVSQARNSNQKHILSRSMTSSRHYRPEVEINHIMDIQPGDIFMLCTDGIFERMDDDALCTLLTDPNYDDVERAQQILHECIRNRDNHTAIIVRVENVINTEGQNHNDALSPGTVLKSENYTYHIEKVLGHGAFGITYLVTTNVSMQGQLGTIHTGVKVALKEFFMHNDMKRDGGELIEIAPESKVKQFSDKFRREASKLAMLSHPNIVRVLEVFEANNTIYYSMEYLPDGTLNDYVMARGGLPEQEAIGCIRRIGSALMYLHANKMLHLDVKPANIMRSESTNTLKLIDFGLAKRYVSTGEAESSANLGVGTSGYAPLEQADGNREQEFSPQIDVYALGATYYKLLTAQVPDTAVEVLNRGLSTMPLVKKKVSQKSIDAIKAAMEPTIAKRLKTVEQFLEMLPRVDDEQLFPQENHDDRWKWMSFAIVMAFLSIVAGVKMLHNDTLSTAPQEEVSVVDSNFEIPMVHVEGGTFLMGSDRKDADADEKPVRKVTLSSFSIGKYEVTQGQWRAVMENVKSTTSKNANYPMFNVTWNQVQVFIERLNKKTGRHYRLPTEAEWEYAARGGKKAVATNYSGDDSLEMVGWYADNSNRHPHTVGSLKPNALGIYDMTGNVWEYCSDFYAPYEGNDLRNPHGPRKGDYHVIRGGSWNSLDNYCRVTFRQDNSLISVTPDMGFRLVETR